MSSIARQEGAIHINLKLSKVELEMLKILRLKDKRYRRGLLHKIQEELKEDYDRIKK